MNEIPIYEKLTLTIAEAAEYSNIGINKINSLLNSTDCTFCLNVGEHKRLVKRKAFEDYINKRERI